MASLFTVHSFAPLRETNPALLSTPRTYYIGKAIPSDE